MSECVIDQNGNQVWYDIKSYKRNKFENISFQIKSPNQRKFYVRLHRENGPAVKWSNGDEWFCIKGQKHREDGPAEIKTDGAEYYYYDGKLHRDDGPAIIHRGAKHYYRHGLMHNEDGPAIIFYDGKVFWYLNNIKYSFEEWCNHNMSKSSEEINFLKLKYNI